LADFNGETSNLNSSFAGGWIDPPASATASAVGYDMSLGWMAGTHGPVTGQSLLGVDNGLSSNCTGAGYTLITGTLTAAATTYTDTSRGTLANDGDWYCYQLVSNSATVWTGPLALSAVQLGLVTTGVSITNGGTANTLQAGDTITLTFNQRTNLAAGSTKVCAFAGTKTVLIGDLKNGNNCGSSAGDGYDIASLTTGATLSADAKFNTSTVSVSTVFPWTATITLANGSNVVTGASPTWTLTPANTILSFVTTRQATMCTTATSTCQPTTATNF
jgi:hypothetical protein